MRSLLIHDAPVWYTLLIDTWDTCKQKIEGIQRSATRVRDIFPDMDYDERLSFLCMPKLHDFVFELCSKHNSLNLAILNTRFLDVLSGITVNDHLA